MSKDYKFADKTFKNKTSALKYFKQYLQEHDSIEEEDYKSIVALMSMHPRGWSSDYKVIIDTIKITPFARPSKCFVVVSKDLIKDARSVDKCFNGYNKLNNVKKCFREIIEPQIQTWRKENTKPNECPKCHKQKSEITDWHIDHIKPFSTLLNEFLTLNNLEIDKIDIKRKVGENPTITDTNIINKWFEYHQEHARLQYLCSNCNIEKSNKN